MKNVVKFTGRFFAAVAAIVFIFGCKAEVSDSEKDYKGETGSISVSFAEGAEARDSRALMISELKSAKAVVIGFDSKGEKFTKTSGVEALTGGKADSISVTDIPVCKNAAVVVTAYSDTTGISEVKGGVISAYVEKIEGGKNNPIEVKWETSKKGNVYAALIEAGVNTNILSDAQISSINNAIPTDIHAILINADAIATAAKAFVEGTGTLGAASSYKLTAGSVKVTCNDYNGMTLQITDPLSSVATASTSGAVTISNVAPGTWTLYVLDGTTVKTSKSVTVTGGEESSVSVGNVPHDGYRVHLLNADSWSTHTVYAYKDNQTGDSWPGNPMNQETNGYYIDLTQSWIKAGESLVIFYGGNNTNRYPADQQPGLVIPADVTEAWYDLSTHSWSISDPNVPTAPSYTLPASATLGGKIKIIVTSSTDLSSASVAIGSVTKTLVVGENSFDVSDFTSVATTLTISGILTNEAGSTNVSGSIVVKEAGYLVSNFNELRIYQIMVSHFQDGDPSIGFTNAYGPSGQNVGGDLKGIMDAADYIESLGVNAIWMTPIFNSNTGSGDQLGSTGYYAYDYFNVDPNFGTNDILKDLVELYHSKGIAVILDGVFGHTSSSGTAQSPKGNKAVKASNYNPVKYGDSLAYFQEVAEYWIKNYKIDGWRLDQCYQVGNGTYGSAQTGGHNYWIELRQTVETAAASNGTLGTDWGTLGYMVGEAWLDNANQIQSSVVAGDGLRSCFDFSGRYSIVESIAGGSEWQSSGKYPSFASNAASTFKSASEKGYSHSKGYYPNLFLTNHDMTRLGDNIKIWRGKGTNDSEYWSRNKLALASLVAYTGPITVYYGDEWGALEGNLSYVTSTNSSIGDGAYWDNGSRTNGKISGFDSNQTELLNYFKDLMSMRSSHEALWNGTNTDIKASGDCYVGKKVGGGETIYYAINNGTSSTSFSASGTDLLSGQTYSGTVTVPALSAVYILAN